MHPNRTDSECAAIAAEGLSNETFAHNVRADRTVRLHWLFALSVRLFVEYPLYKKAIDMQKRIEYNIKV